MSPWHLAAYPIILVFTASFAMLISYFAWQRRATLGSKTLALLMLAVTVWAFADTLEVLVTKASAKVFLSQISYIGIHSVSPLFLILALKYSQRKRYLIPGNIALLWVIPTIIIGLAATNQWHHLIWTKFSWDSVNPTILIYHYGPAFWVGAIYSYLLTIIAIANLTWGVSHLPTIFQPQLTVLILAALLPWIGNFLYVIKQNPFPGRDLTPTAFLLTGILIAWSMFRYKFLDITPIARDKLIDTMLDAVIVVDDQFRVRDINQAAQSIVGKSNNAIIGEPAHKVLSHWPFLETLFRGQTDIPTKKDIISDKENRWYELKTTPLQKHREYPQGWLITLHDISAHKELETALRESEALHRSVIESTNDGIAIVQNSIVKYCNPQLASMLGYQVEDIEKKPFVKFIAPDQAKIIQERHERRIRGESTPAHYETEVLHASGEHIAVEFNISSMKYNQKIAVLAMIRDIRERLSAQEKINRLAAVAEQAQETIVITNLEGDIEYANPHFEKTSGYSPDEAIGKNPNILQSGQHDTAFYQNLWDTITAGDTWTGKFINKRKNGTLYHEEAIIFPIVNQSGQTSHYAGVKRDISAQVQAEEELLEYARQQELLNDITRTTIETTNRDDDLLTLADYLKKLVHADRCFIHLWGVKVETQPTPEKGLIEIALDKERPVIIEDVFNSPYFSPEQVGKLSYRSIWVLPLIVNQQKLGTVSFIFNQVHTFTKSTIALGRQASYQIALALFKNHLLETAKKRATEAETLRQAGTAITATLKLNQAVEQILEQLNRVVPYNSASVQLLHGDQIEIVGQRGFQNVDTIMGLQFSINDDTPNKLVVSQRKPIILADAPAAYSIFEKPPHNHTKSWLGVPLIIQDRVIGMIALDSTQAGRFDQDHARLASAFTAQVAVVLENARLYEETRRLAI
ncbi:MAG: PAS domain S-box protein, partial [Chloroflexota bacterium]|nr:PAS domain S-box protein [Chloroflexota bacterium]